MDKQAFDVYAYQMSLLANGPYESFGKDLARLYVSIFAIQFAIAGYCYVCQ
jgi:hypothetical protein